MEERERYSETGIKPEKEPSEEFKQMVLESLDSITESYELFQMENITPMDISPFSFSGLFERDEDGKLDVLEEEDERVFSDLSESEKAFIRHSLQQQLGLELNPNHVKRTYYADAIEGSSWEGRAGASVYGTDDLLESDMLLHHWYYPDGREGYLLAPLNYEYFDEETQNQGGEDEL